jgi:nucleoid-associated protein YgaU
MGFFDRRKDVKAGQQPEADVESSPEQPRPSSGPMPVASEVKEQRIREEPTVAAAPPAPPLPPAPSKPEAAEPAADPEPSAPPAPHASVAEPAKVEPVTQIHTVAAGETLVDLAGRYGVGAEEIARQNHLAPGAPVHSGQVFVIRRD